MKKVLAVRYDDHVFSRLDIKFYKKTCKCGFTARELEELGACMTGNDGIPYCSKCGEQWIDRHTELEKLD